MTWKPGESGNPAGRAPRGKTYADVLRAALEKPDPATGKRNLEVIAEKAIALAKEGEVWAIGHIADRLDGKPDSMINSAHGCATWRRHPRILRQRIAEPDRQG
jgi:hypothetical protein